MNGLLDLDNETLLIILESIGDYFLAMRFVLSFSKTFYGSIQHMHLLKIHTIHRKEDNIAEWWEVDSRIHREGDLPAIIYPNDHQIWYKNGKRHREEVRILSNGTKVGGPAVIQSNGFQIWYKNGQLHREDGPAITHLNGFQEWYKNGERIKQP